MIGFFVLSTVDQEFEVEVHEEDGDYAVKEEGCEHAKDEVSLVLAPELREQVGHELGCQDLVPVGLVKHRDQVSEVLTVSIEPR